MKLEEYIRESIRGKNSVKSIPIDELTEKSTLDDFVRFLDSIGYDGYGDIPNGKNKGPYPFMGYSLKRCYFFKDAYLDPRMSTHLLTINNNVFKDYGETYFEVYFDKNTRKIYDIIKCNRKGFNANRKPRKEKSHLRELLEYVYSIDIRPKKPLAQ